MLRAGDRLDLTDELATEEVELEVQLEDFAVVLFYPPVEHVGEDVLVDDLLLLVCDSLAAQGVKLLPTFFLCCVNEESPNGPLVIK